MRSVKIMLVMLLVLVMQINVKADGTCSNDELARLRHLAEKVELSYDYEWRIGYFENGQGYTFPSFNVTAANLNQELKVMIEKDYLKSDYVEFKDDGTGKGTIKRFGGGSTITVTIRGYTQNNCSGKIVAIKTITLPVLNLFSYEDVCFKYQDFQYCSLFLDKRITADFFTQELQKYLNNTNQNMQLENPETTVTNNTITIIIVVTSIVFVLGIVTFLVIKKKKTRL